MTIGSHRARLERLERAAPDQDRPVSCANYIAACFDIEAKHAELGDEDAFQAWFATRPEIERRAFEGWLDLRISGLEIRADKEADLLVRWISWLDDGAQEVWRTQPEWRPDFVRAGCAALTRCGLPFDTDEERLLKIVEAKAEGPPLPCGLVELSAPDVAALEARLAALEAEVAELEKDDDDDEQSG